MDYTETTYPDINATTQSDTNDQQGQPWYDMLDNYDIQTPETGQILEGEIIQISDDALLVDVGMKRDAVVAGRDLSMIDESVKNELSVGDRVFVYVLRPAVGDEDLLVSLNKGFEHQSWEKAERYLASGEVEELEITGKNRGGFLVKFETLQGFLPFSQVPELRRTRGQQQAGEIKRDMISTHMPMKVVEVDRYNNRLVLSAEAAQADNRQQRLQNLNVGQTVRGRVVSIVDFGVFIGLDGIDGLIHVSEMDWQKVRHPSEIFKVGDEVEAQVIDINLENEQVSLSRKTLLPSPWQTVQDRIKPGDVLEGTVTKVLHFGAFVELFTGVEGLIHSSELGYSAGVDPQSAVKRGEKVLVRVLKVEPEKERVALSMRQVPQEEQIAWAMEHAE